MKHLPLKLGIFILLAFAVASGVGCRCAGKPENTQAANQTAQTAGPKKPLPETAQLK